MKCLFYLAITGCNLRNEYSSLRSVTRYCHSSCPAEAVTAAATPAANSTGWIRWPCCGDGTGLGTAAGWSGGSASPSGRAPRTSPPGTWSSVTLCCTSRGQCRWEPSPLDRPWTSCTLPGEPLRVTCNAYLFFYFIVVELNADQRCWVLLLL